LDDIRICQELPVRAPEDAFGMGYEVDGGDLLLGMFPACDFCVEAYFDGVVLSGEHHISRRVFYRDEEVDSCFGRSCSSWRGRG
jgi:hypothetical protein